MSYIEKEKERIIQELLQSKQIKPGQLIDYKFLKTIYEPYRGKIKEVDFAHVLGISYTLYIDLRNDENRKAKVLKDKIKRISESEKEDIIEELIQSGKIKPGQLITYSYFLELYKPYEMEIIETDFATILGISYGSHNTMKNKGTRATVLKGRIKQISELEKENILEELLKTNKIKPGQLIDYEYFLKIYQLYKEKISEVDFSKILRIRYPSYLAIKNRGERTTILKNWEQEKINTEDIIEELMQSSKIKPGQLIDYEYFLEVYQLYKEKISEIDFAQILGIEYANYMSFKNIGTKATVLKNKVKELSEEEKERIVQELLDSNKIKVGQLIDYTYFLELYEPYEGKLNKGTFAEILGISYTNCRTMKNMGTRATVLKGRIKQISELEKEKIIKELLETKKIKIGDSIDYECFLKLYVPYKDEVKETEFAQMLGINYSNWLNIKHLGAKAKIYEYITKQKIDRIKYILQQASRYYSKQEIEQIAKEYEININTIIQHILCGGYEKDVSDYITLLEEKGQIWIGKITCSKDFANEHARIIIEQAERISKILCFKYGCMHIRQDLAGDAIERVLQQGGDIDKNFYDKEETSKKWITYRILRSIKIGCLRNLKTKECSFYGKFTYKCDENERNVFDRGIKDNTQRNIQDEVEEKILRETREKENLNLEETCIKLLMEHVELGLDREEALWTTGEMLNINPEEMLQILQNYMIKQNKVRETEDGEYILRE